VTKDQRKTMYKERFVWAQLSEVSACDQLTPLLFGLMVRHNIMMEPCDGGNCSSHGSWEAKRKRGRGQSPNIPSSRTYHQRPNFLELNTIYLFIYYLFIYLFCDGDQIQGFAHARQEL
jgi:hypothetical protein